MKTKNAMRVDKFRKSKGNDIQKKRYHVLRKKYGIESIQANKMKCWSVNRIIDYLRANKITPLKRYKAVDVS